MRNLIFFTLILILSACSTGVEKSKEPGVLRITLTADPSDTTITIVNKTYQPDSTSIMYLNIFEAKVYSDSNYAKLVPTLEDFRDDGNFYNIIKRENDNYQTYIIYESYVPPGEFDKIQFGLTASMLYIDGFGIPLQLPENESLLFDLDLDFFVEENDTTEIKLQIKPLESLVRYRDTYLYKREIKVIDTKHLK